LSAAISARAASGPSAFHQSAAIHVGCEWRSAASVGGTVAERCDEPRGLTGAAPQHRVDELRAPGRLVLDQLHRFPDRGMGRHAIGVDELVQADAQRCPDDRLELLDRPARQSLDQVVERRPPLDGAVGQTHRESALARIQAETARLAVQGTVGPGAVLEDTAHDREGACTRR
jgi:hypothetical protein